MHKTIDDLAIASLSSNYVALPGIFKQGDLYIGVVYRNGTNEFILKHMSEQIIRNTLKRAGYPYSKSQVQVSILY